MLEPTSRFTSRVENYIKYRPGYPAEILDILREECGLDASWGVADMGSGTGLLSELFLKNGNLVYGIEPNAAMRSAGEAILGEYPNFASVDGTAESTTLPDSWVEMITAGQAFHWFDRAEAKKEFARILCPGGRIVLVWNDRLVTGNKFLEEYDRLLREFTREYEQVSHRSINEEVLADFFAPGACVFRHCRNSQTFDFDGLKGRLLSSSYSFEPGDSGYEPMIAELTRIFKECEQDGRVVLEYETRVYIGGPVGLV